jgi:dihydropyrimidinase
LKALQTKKIFEGDAMNVLIKNGTIVTETSQFSADLLIAGEKIKAVGTDLTAEGDTTVIDAANKYILPGAIDAHTHLAMPFGGTVSADDYFTGTRAAACGGTTTVFDFALQDFGESLVDTVKRRDKICAPDAAVDYAFHVGVKDIKGGLIETIKDAVAFGVPSFKVFMVYDFGVSDGVFYELLSKSKEYGALISVHAENKEIIDFLTEKYISEGKTSSFYHYLSRPEFCEEEAVNRAISWAKANDSALYIVHLACKGGAAAVEAAKREGYKIFAETCPQYLEFNSDVYKREDGKNFVCSPPMKNEEARQAIIKALQSGVIDTVATDHCPFQLSEKEWGKDDFRKIPNGCAGVENMYPYMLSLAGNGVISYSRAVEVCSYNPAKIFGCADKGSLTPGKDADIVIYDPAVKFTIKNEKMHSAVDHTIWEGKELSGYPEKVYSRGKLVYENGEFKGEKGYGKFVKRKLTIYD